MDKFALLALLRTRQMQILLHLPNLTSHTMLETTTCNFFSFQHGIGWGGGTVMWPFFQTSAVKHIQLVKLHI